MPTPPTTSIETLRSGHPVVWSRPAAERPGTDLVLVLHGYGSNEVRAANRFFPMLPERCTRLAVRGGFEIDAAAAERWLELMGNSLAEIDADTIDDAQRHAAVQEGSAPGGAVNSAGGPLAKRGSPLPRLRRWGPRAKRGANPQPSPRRWPAGETRA